MAGSWINKYTTRNERLMATVFLTGFTIPFLVGVFQTTYAVATGFVMIMATVYLAYRVLIYRTIKFAHKRITDSSA